MTVTARNDDTHATPIAPAGSRPGAPRPWSDARHSWTCHHHWSGGCPTPGWCGRYESLGHRRHPPAAHPTQVVGVDLQADAIELARIDAQVGRHRANAFGQDYRRAAVQQAVGLMGTVIDDHAGGQGLFVETFEANIQQLTDGVFLLGIELLDIGLGAPQAHTVVLLVL